MAEEQTPDYAVNVSDVSTTLNVEKSKKIQWTNDTSGIVILDPPDCVSPDKEEEIAVGAKSKMYQVNAGNDTHGDYTYTANDKPPGPLATRNGTIHVGP